MSYVVPNIMVIVNKVDKPFWNALMDEGTYYTFLKERDRLKVEEGLVNEHNNKLVALASARALHGIYGGKELAVRSRNNAVCIDIKAGTISEIGNDGAAISEEDKKEAKRSVKRAAKSEEGLKEIMDEESGGVNWYKSMMWVIWAVSMLSMGKEVDESKAPSKIALGWFMFFKEGDKDMVKMFCKDIIPKTLPSKAYFEKMMAFKDSGEDLSILCEDLIKAKIESVELEKRRLKDSGN